MKSRGALLTNPNVDRPNQSLKARWKGFFPLEHWMIWMHGSLSMMVFRHSSAEVEYFSGSQCRYSTGSRMPTPGGHKKRAWLFFIPTPAHTTSSFGHVLGMFWACFGHVFSVFLHHTSSSLEKLEIARASQLANSIGRWIPARVLGVTPSGNFNLDCKWSTQKLQTQPWSFESVDSAHGSLAKMYLLWFILSQEERETRWKKWSGLQWILHALSHAILFVMIVILPRLSTWIAWLHCCFKHCPHTPIDVPYLCLHLCHRRSDVPSSKIRPPSKNPGDYEAFPASGYRFIRFSDFFNVVFGWMQT